MEDTHHVLVVAERAADPARLVEMIGRRAHAAPLDVTLLVPSTLYGLDWAGDPRAAIPAAAHYAERLRRDLAQAGVDVTRTLVGDPDPRAAIDDALLAGPFAEVVISRPPKRLAQLMRLDLPRRVEQATDAPVTWVRAERVAHEPRRHHRHPHFGRRPALRAGS
jgi:hypothetical protein